MNTNTIAKNGMRCTGKTIIIICLAAFFALNLPTALAQPAVIHVHESGGAAALTQALTDVAEPGTIYVHSGTYDLGATATSFLTITKAVTIVGFDDGIGKPIIKGARPSGNPGLLLVNAPGKAVVLDSLVLSFYGSRPPNTNTAVQVLGSNGFTVRDCTINAAFLDGTNSQGLYAAITIAGPTQSEFPVLPFPPTATSVPNPNYPFRNNVRGEVRILRSMLTSRVSGVAIGFTGPVRLDNIEVSNCLFNSLGYTPYGDGNRGNFGLMIIQYPFYLTDANQAALIEATHTETRTSIRNNTVTASNPLYLFYLKGVQRIERNRLHSASAWYDSGAAGGKFFQLGIMAVGYPHDPSDPATYSEAVIRDNVIALQVPPFPLPAITTAPTRPAQTTSNTFPPTGIWLGIGAKFAYPSSALTGHYAKATVTGNIISSSAFPGAGPRNTPDYGLHFRSETKNCVVTGNNLAGGRLVDPIDRRMKFFEPFTAKVAQLYVGPEAHDNYFGPATRHEWLEDCFEPTALVSESAEMNSWGGRHQPGNRFGPAGIAGVLCYGQNNLFRENQFYGDYWGWEPGAGPGLFWLTDTTHHNRIEMTRLNGRGMLLKLCRQFYDETDWGWNRYQGLNSIQGFGRCHPKSADFSQRMQTLKKTIEERLEKF